MTGLRWTVALTLACLIGAHPGAQAQVQNAAPASDEVAMLAQGWAQLARGEIAQAAVTGANLIAGHPRSAAVLAFWVEAEIARAHAAGGLDAYERWLGTRRLDDAYVLRQVALWSLRETITRPGIARLAALKALAAEGDPAADAELRKGAYSGNIAEQTLLASLGDERTVNILVSELNSSMGNKADIVNALAHSGSKLAIPPLVNLLTDDLHPQLKAAAADGLGRLGATDAIPRIKPLLDDSLISVRVSAATALYRLEDMSGMAILQKQLDSEYAAVRYGALDAMSSHPDAAWVNGVREVIRDSDPTIRLYAARLLAPYDPDLAKSVLDQLLTNDNLAVREEASRVLAERVAGDFATLRRLLHSSDAIVQVNAAGRILELTR
jgi:HEAT repeat protein